MKTSSFVRETGNGAEIVEIKSGEGAVDGDQLDELLAVEKPKQEKR